jgi:hypothetical protein
MKYRYLPGILILWMAFGGFTACGRKEAVTTGRLDSESGSFSLYTYDDSADRGDSTIALYRETVRNEKGEEESAWTLRGKVTTKYEYGYAGVVLVPDEKNLARLRDSAETIKPRISGDGRHYRLSVDTENVTDGNTFGTEITTPERSGEIVISVAALKQYPGQISSRGNPAVSSLPRY